MDRMLATLPLYQVDAFTDRPFAGNPAAVCLLDAAPSERWMADVAAEMNLAETAFTWPEGTSRRLRWFTPTVEVPLCGHATLATAHVLWRERQVADDQPLRFETLSGALTAVTDGPRVRLDLPTERPTPADPEDVAAAAAALRVPIAEAAVFGANLLVHVGDPVALRGLDPDSAGVAALPHQGLLVTSDGDDEGDVDYLVRYFAPKVGIPEDPVTGSAQCAAGPWWQARTGRSHFTVEQASPRSGRLVVDVGDGRVAVAGHAVTVLRAEILAPAS